MTLCDRAWAEISLDALLHNISALRQFMPAGCEMMAVLKANAYGHGLAEIAKACQSFGVKAYAVATLDEAITLRKTKAEGIILILGYTSPERIREIKKWQCTQTILDLDYAQLLNNKNVEIDVHVAVDTGMRRLGIKAEELESLIKMYNFENLSVTGSFSHLFITDSLAAPDIQETDHQIQLFFDTMEKLKDRGIHPGNLHIQGSYGLLNHPHLPCRYARIGAALFGVIDEKRTSARLNLKPVLTLKARVAMVKEVHINEGIGYNHAYTAKKKMKIAVLSIGYSDGISRSLSRNPNACCLIHGQRAQLIGNLCMDQCTVDITDIEDVCCGDVVTFIGTDKDETILGLDLAAWTDTIVPDTLSAITSRVKRIYK